MNDLSTILRPIELEMKLVSNRFRKALDSNIKLIIDVIQYITQRVGKRLRPALLILSSKTIGDCDDIDSLVTAATVIELVHTATLIHDDSIDGTTSRRGIQTVNHKWSHQISVLMGDYLLAKAFALCAELKNQLVMETMADTSQILTEGEMMEIEHSWNTDISEDDYFKTISSKTASLFSASCKIGTVFSNNHNRDLYLMFGRFGEYIGYAFQIIDDIFDYTSTKETIGKPVGNDIREGKITLPLIHSLRSAPASEAEKIKNHIKRRDFGDDEWNDILSLVKKYKGIEYSYQKAKEFIDLAKNEISSIKESSAKKSLIMLADYIIDREK